MVLSGVMLYSYIIEFVWINSVYIKHSVYSRDVTRREFMVLYIIFNFIIGVCPQIIDPMHASVIKMFIINM